jgi:hypothetical protein
MSEQALTKADASQQLATMLDERAAAAHIHQDGIYFGLDENAYHDDPSLGSTDLRRLARNPTSYWWDSPMNPARPRRRETPSLLFGRAMHKLIYEGADAFDRLYIRGPDQDPEASPAEKAQRTKKANERARAEGKDCLPAESYDRIVVSSAMITKNPELATVFSGGMSEVSVFWVKDGVRLKARLDYLKIRGVGDLKSVANQYDNDFETECHRAIASYRYDAQAAHYLDARAALPKLVAEGRVNGDHDAEWLRKVCASRFAWQWIFFQSENAPITFSLILSPQNPMVELGRAVIERGLARWREYMEQWGPNEIWLLIKKPREIAVEDMPGWYGR